jgi:hypothetical protein
MPKSSEVTYTCDRDGTVSAVQSGPPPNAQLTPPPQDWNTLNTNISPPPGGVPQTSTVYLCPTCAAKFVDFMAQRPT